MLALPDVLKDRFSNQQMTPFAMSRLASPSGIDFAKSYFSGYDSSLNIIQSFGRCRILRALGEFQKPQRHLPPINMATGGIDDYTQKWRKKSPNKWA
jgi:hypothetical protein